LPVLAQSDVKEESVYSPVSYLERVN